MSPEGFEIANHLICDASCSTGHEEEEEEDEKSKEEDIKISSKSSKTSVGCWPECIHYCIKLFFLYHNHNPHGFARSLKIENMSVLSFVKLTQTREYCFI